MIRVDPATVVPAPAPPLVELQLALLTRLAEIGMEIAEEAGRQATGKASAEAAPMRDPGLVYARVARAVRLTIALQSRLMDGRAAARQADEVAQIGRRRRVERLVERAVEAEYAEGDDIRSLQREARESFDRAELDADLDGLTFSEVVARICGDLGLAPDRAARIVAAAQATDDPPVPSPPGAAPATSMPDRASVSSTHDPRPLEGAPPCVYRFSP